MMKKGLLTFLALLIMAVPACADVFSGTTVARNATVIIAQESGMIDKVYIQPGSIVNEGETIASLRTTKVFANQNGTVARIHAKVGEEKDGAVLEISPVSRYTIHCTAGGAYDSVSSNLVHCGELLYLCCTTNGTHQGSGRVYSIDGETYMVEASAGEFYVGETVYLYRDQDYSSKQRVGIGTVVSSAEDVYESEGRITAIHVSEGEYVEKGELLYEVIQGKDARITAPSDGIITSCEVEGGISIEYGQSVAGLAPYDEICIAVWVEEEQISRISIGSSAELAYVCREEAKLVTGAVVEISDVAQDGSYMVLIAPEEPPARIGLSVEVWLEA